MININSDVTIIGAGPGGLASAVSAKLNGAKKVIVLDRNNWLGGILPQCIHDGFGVEELGKSLTGPEYADLYITEARKNKILPWIFMVIIYLVAISRIIIGVHDLQDVWGGLLIGIAFLLVFIYLEPIFSEKINKLNLTMKMVLAIVVPVLLLLLALLVFPGTLEDYGMDCGAMMGISLGYLIESEKVKYDPREIGVKQKILNVIIGIVITLLVYLILSLIPLDFLIWDFIEYLILSLVLVTIVPWIFTKIKR